MSLFDRLRDETEEEGKEGESDQPATDGGDAATDDPFDDGEFGEMGDEFGDEDGFGDLSMDEQAQDLDGDSDNTEKTEGDGFADLKAEYESGEAEWDEEGAGFEAATTATDPAATVTTEDSSEREVDTELQYAEHTLSDAPDAEKPYLRGSFDGYIADLLVLEWLEYLVDAAGPAATEGAISYYESIRWIDEDAGEQLRAFIDGFATSENEEEAANLTVAHHTQSLRYICQLSSSTTAPVVLDGWKEHPRSYRR